MVTAIFLARIATLDGKSPTKPGCTEVLVNAGSRSQWGFRMFCMRAWQPQGISSLQGLGGCLNLIE